MTIVLMLVGLGLLLVGANYLTEGSSAIAKRFGISEGKVKSVLHRMRLRLKRYLEGEGITV